MRTRGTLVTSVNIKRQQLFNVTLQQNMRIRGTPVINVNIKQLQNNLFNSTLRLSMNKGSIHVHFVILSLQQREILNFTLEEYINVKYA